MNTFTVCMYWRHARLSVRHSPAMLLYILNIAHYALIFTEHCCKYRTVINIGMLLTFPLKTIQPSGQRRFVWTYWELHEPRDRVAARSKSVATLSFNGSGPGNQFTVHFHINRPIIHFPLAFYWLLFYSHSNTGQSASLFSSIRDGCFCF